jgi:magnesium chelatase family protein
MNPCPCGFKGYAEAKCVGSAACERYAGKISGPLLDRVDLHVTVPRLKPDELTGEPNGESSEAIRGRVVAARAMQASRFGKPKVNAQMTPREIKASVEMDDECREFLQTVATRLNLSARVYDRVLKVARTIADLTGSERIAKPHLAEAVQYRGQTKD